MGVNIIKKAVRQKISTIVRNAGLEPASTLEKIPLNDNTGYGYDALNDKFVDMFGTGISSIPQSVREHPESPHVVQVVRTALQDAAGVASLLATTECVVNELPKEDPVPGMGSMEGLGGMGGGGMF